MERICCDISAICSKQCEQPNFYIFSITTRSTNTQPMNKRMHDFVETPHHQQSISLRLNKTNLQWCLRWNRKWNTNYSWATSKENKDISTSSHVLGQLTAVMVSFLLCSIGPTTHGLITAVRRRYSLAHISRSSTFSLVQLFLRELLLWWE